MYSFDPKINALAEAFLEEAQAYQDSKTNIFDGITRDPLDPAFLHTTNEKDLILARDPAIRGVHYHGTLPQAFEAISKLGVKEAHRHMDSALTLNNYRLNGDTPQEIIGLVEATKQQSTRLHAIACALNERHAGRRIHQTIAGAQMMGVHHFHADTGGYTVSSSFDGLGTEYALVEDLGAAEMKALANEPEHRPSFMRYAGPGDIMAYSGQQYTTRQGNGLRAPEKSLWHRSPNIPENRFWAGFGAPSYEDF